MKKVLQDKIVVITGGTGSLGKVLTRQILTGYAGKPKKIIIFSRDEAKQHFMRLEYLDKKGATDEVIYNNFKQLLEFRIGDIRDYHSVCSLLSEADIVINAAALKQVPTCEYFPFEAVQTNIVGPENIIRAIQENHLKVETVVGVSTDKACKPVCVMGMTKALQERIFINANLTVPTTRFICVRYGNVLASRGSVIPLFLQQIKNGGPVTITTKEMTRFLLPLERAVNIVLDAIGEANPGEMYIPKVPSARIIDIAKVLIEDRPIKIKIIGIRPGEKIHEVMVSEEEAWRTYTRGRYYVIKPILPELMTKEGNKKALNKEYSSADSIMDIKKTKKILETNRLMVGQLNELEGELLK